MTSLTVTRIEVFESSFETRDLGLDAEGIAPVYEPGARRSITTYGYRVHTDNGVTGEFVGGDAPSRAQVTKLARWLVGTDATQRERFYDHAKRALRKHDRMGIGPLDIALWDLAGKAYGAPVAQLLGGWRTRLPAYASTMAGDRNGGLDGPSAYAEFAVACQELGYHGYKMHIPEDYRLAELLATIRAVREAVGPDMALMLDPGSKLETFLDAVQVARACEDAGYLWLEDPYKDGGVSAFGNARLRTLARVPLLLTEHVRGLEQHVNMIQAGATDLVRVNAEYDGGLTGAVKIAHAAEGFGLDVEVHAPGPAHRHLMAALRNTNFYEMCLVHPRTPEIGRLQQVYWDGYRDGLDAVGPDGCVPVPTGPGLGVAYDWELLTRNAVDSATFT
jgi:L-alanine-DL-glutamate epimerase-like enolase superfamily enzyme